MLTGLQQLANRTIEERWFQWFVMALIILNALILGAETIDGFTSELVAELMLLDRIIVGFFVLELILRFIADPRGYFKSGWNIFDFLIVAVSVFAASSGLAAVRALRVLRVLRVITVFPRMRVVVSALFEAIPGIFSVGVILLLLVYVFAVIAANLYGALHEELFGDVFKAMYTLFTVMTLEGWREIADQVAETHPRSWVFFLSFVLIATFTMLNLFVAIVVRVVEDDNEDQTVELETVLGEEIRALRQEVASLKDLLRDGAGPSR